MTRRAVTIVPYLAAAIVCMSIATVAAHDRKTSGPLTVVIGWASEPAFSGSLNGVAVSLSDRTGPLARVEGDLSVEVSFGNERITLPLERVANQPNEFHAPLVPTRAGTYAFRVTGTINKQAIDVSSTCSDATFHCVTDAAAIQFPVKDPSVGQLAERIDRALPRGDEAGKKASQAGLMAGVAVGVSLVAFTVALIVGLRASRKPA